MSSLFSKTAKMASQAVGSSPEANLELNAPPNQRLYFVNGDEISGALSIEIPNEIHHQGIKVILRGVIHNTSRDMYFGAALGGMLSSGAKYGFIKLTRDLDAPGSLQQGTFDYRFQFKNVDLDVDSYQGIALDVRYEVVAEMVYQGSVMSYTLTDSRIFQVRNSQQTLSTAKTEQTGEEESKGGTEVTAAQKAAEIAAPRLKVDFCGFRAHDKPCILELYLHNTVLHIDRDQISGSIRMRQLADEIQSRIKYVKLQLVQQEIQGCTKAMPAPQVGQAFIDQMNGGAQPYKLRVIKDFQVMDGCCDEGDTIDFRLPLRGASCQYLCPTIKNVYNKFSVRFFIRFVLFVKVRFRVAAKKAEEKKESNNDGASSEEENEREALEGDSDFEEIESYSEQTEVSSNFLEVNLFR